jgi:hypothetical protein
MFANRNQQATGAGNLLEFQVFTVTAHFPIQMTF